MSGTIRPRADPTSPGALPQLARKIAFLVGEGVLDISSCRIALSVARELAREVVVITSAPDPLAQLGVPPPRSIDFNCGASLKNPAADGLAAWRLARILEEESAETLHIVGVRSAVLCALALKLLREHRIMVQLPDLGLLEADRLPPLYRPSPARLVGSLLRRQSSFLLVETPQDLAFLRTLGADPGARCAVVGGGGVDPDVYPVLPPSHSEMPIAAFVGTLSRSSGIEILMRAFDRAWARGVHLQLELASPCMSSPQDPVAPDELAQWLLHPGIRMADNATDVRELWRRAEICVLPATTRQGLPRGLLEAAACGRALIVTDRAGAGFVRHEIDGLVVPCADVGALADAMERLARDAQLRSTLGTAARLRVLQGFTENHVEQATRAAYLSLLGSAYG